VLAALDALGHLDLLDASATDQKPFEQGLGRRRLSVFRTLRRAELVALEKTLFSRHLDTEDLEARGRLRRLLGRLGEADTDFARAGTRRALSWRGEALVYAHPARALELLRRAEGENDPWPSFWSGLALINARRSRAARAALERADELFGAKAPFVFRLVLAQSCLSAGDLHGARAASEAALCMDRSSPAAHAMLGRRAHLAGDVKGSIERFHAARDLDMDMVGEYLFERFDFAWNKPEAYLGALTRALARRPRCAALYAERAELLRHPRFCRYAMATRDYEKAAALEPRVAWLRAVLARARSNAGDAWKGLSDFDRAAALAPDSGWIRAWRGAALSRAGRIRAALRDFAAAERLMPGYPFTYAWRGAALVRQHRWKEACVDLDKALELDPEYLFSRYERFHARLGRGDLDGAVADLNASFRADPKYTWLGRAGERAFPALDLAARARPESAWLRAWRGHSLLDLGRAPEAAEDLDSAARLLPREPLIRAWRARALATMGLAAPARREFEACLRLDPGLWAAHMGLAELDGASGRWKAAYLRLRRAAELAPTTVSAYVGAASAAVRLGKNRQALADLAHALELDPGCLEAALLAAELRLRRGELAAAAAHLDAVFREPEPSPRAFAARGLLRQCRGEARGAAEDFRRAFALDPSVFPPGALESLERLML
jgi:tetratricopeptide (TPR) repeat protein